MTTRDWFFLALAVMLSFAASLLAAGETALQRVTRSRAARMVDEGVRGSARVAEIAADPAPTINTAMLVRTACETATAVLVSVVFFTHLGQSWERVLAPVVVVTLVSFIFWGVMPRTLGRQHAERTALRAARPLTVLNTLLGWLTTGIIAVGNAITPGRGFADGPFSSEAELREMVDMAEKAEVIEHDEREMIHSVFELGDTLVREVMVPRTDIVFIEVGKTIRQAMSLALRSGFSRIPVISGQLDDVRGVVYLKDLMKQVFDDPASARGTQVDTIMRPAVFCPDSKPVDELLREMQATRNHMVLVVDEFGGCAGLATIEDLVEEIVGEITDEYDAEPSLAEELPEGGWRISARMPLDDVGDLFGKELGDEDVETAGGLMAKLLNRVPIPGSTVDWEGLRLRAEKATGRRHQIDTIVVTELASQPDDADREDEDD
ncbi:Hemolysin, contains CBS domains [Propionibacterium cyclohexanicum]|uniref:Hemolysin, contains CBS domains n=1 Tax=Propionibacterium cyclohexanicum TaxID=64702 RepID=A0A1H9Q6U9_9ACTN|nr:hemolysin family protein [Propionibacterium cyclohexanicum]SER56148.1 Hemolysin, contains CBS domains [Propionibacterium cyclohexanicum]